MDIFGAVRELSAMYTMGSQCSQGREGRDASRDRSAELIRGEVPARRRARAVSRAAYTKCSTPRVDRIKSNRIESTALSHA